MDTIHHARFPDTKATPKCCAKSEPRTHSDTRTHSFIHLLTHSHIHLRTHSHILSHTSIHSLTHLLTFPRTRTRIHSLAHISLAHIHADVFNHPPTHAHIQSLQHTPIHSWCTFTHTFTHTHTHTHTHRRWCQQFQVYSSARLQHSGVMCLPQGHVVAPLAPLPPLWPGRRRTATPPPRQRCPRQRRHPSVHAFAFNTGGPH